MKSLVSVAVFAASAILFHASAAIAQDGGRYNFTALALEVPTDCLVDADYNTDGDVNAGDYLVFQRQYDQSAGLADPTDVSGDEVGLFDGSRFMLDEDLTLVCDPDELPRLPWPPKPLIILGGSIGADIPLNRPPFGATQFIIPSTSLTGRLYAELFWPHRFGPRTHLAFGLAGIYGSTVPRMLGNVGSTARLNTGGVDSHWGGVVYGAVERVVAPLVNVRLQAGAGVARRSLNLTVGGTTAAQGTGVVPVVQFGGQVFRRLNDNVDIGLGLFATRIGGINTNVGGTTVRLGPSWDARITMEMRVVLDRVRRSTGHARVNSDVDYVPAHY